MAYFHGASARRRKTSRGVNPGSGVAQGGHVGRSTLAHNGVTGARAGGATTRASQRRVLPATGPGAFQYGGNWYFRNKQGNVARSLVPTAATRRISAPTGFSSAPFRAGAVPSPAAAPAVSPAPNLSDPGVYQDSNYFDDLRAQQGTFDEQLNPVISRLTSLQAKGIGGKTLYDLLYEQAQGKFQQDTYAKRDEASRGGLLRSGWLNQQSSNMGHDWLTQQDQLDREYGKSAINQLTQQQQQIQNQWAQQQALIAQAAQRRAQEQYLARLAQQYAPNLPEG